MYMSVKNVKVATATIINVAVADVPIVEARNAIRLEKSTLGNFKEFARDVIKCVVSY